MALTSSYVIADRLMHRRERPRQTQTGEPRPDWTVLYFHVPRAHHGIDAADEVFNRQQANPTFSDRDAAVSGVVAIVAHHKQPIRRDEDIGCIVEESVFPQFENRVWRPARQGFNEFGCRRRVPLFVLCLTGAVAAKINWL